MQKKLIKTFLSRLAVGARSSSLVIIIRRVCDLRARLSTKKRKAKHVENCEKFTRTKLIDKSFKVQVGILGTATSRRFKKHHRLMNGKFAKTRGTDREFERRAVFSRVGGSRMHTLRQRCQIRQHNIRIVHVWREKLGYFRNRRLGSGFFSRRLENSFDNLHVAKYRIPTCSIAY